MIPRIQTGKSFKGAALYYLHDKAPENGPKATTRERVAWTYTLNCLHDDPERAIGEMQHICLSQERLKLEAGKPVEGRPVGKPVMTVALAWPPDLRPNQMHMIEAAQDFLNHMGWQEHQVLMVAHNDTKHAHVHLIINKVHPENGMTLNAAWYKNRAQDWGLKFEREHGHVYCLKRVENERDRQHGRPRQKDKAFAHYGEWRTANQEMNREGIFDPENAELATSAEWAGLRKEQKEERIAFWKENNALFRQIRRQAYAQVKDEFAGQWQNYQKDAATTRLAIKKRQAETNRLCKYYAQQTRALHGGLILPSHIEGVKKARAAQAAYAREMREALKQQREQIKTAMRERFQGLSEQALVLLKEDRAKEYQQVLARHREDKRGLKQDQAQGRRRYDLLEKYGKSSANDNREHGRDREAANANLPPFARTAQIIRGLNDQQQHGQDLSRYLARAREALSKNPFAKAPSSHAGDRSMEEASCRALSAIERRDYQRRQEDARRRQLIAEPHVKESFGDTADELSGAPRQSARQDNVDASSQREQPREMSLAEQIRRAADALKREGSSEKSDRRAREGHGASEQSGRDRGGGRER